MKTIDRFTFRMPTEAKSELKKIAKTRGYPMNVLLLQWVWEKIEEERGR